MFYKNYLKLVLITAALLLGSITAFAQNSVVSGRVEMADDKGVKTPVANALIEAYRTDTKENPVSSTSDEKGDFKFTGLPSGKVFALVVSGEGIEPSVVTDVDSGATDLAVTVTAGSGKKPAAVDVRQALLAAGKLKLSDAEKAEEERLNKEREARNVKAAQSDAAAVALLKEGNQAFNNKNFDLAITKFDEGYKLSPEFLGSAPGFLNNKGTVLGVRAVEFHNKGVKEEKEARAATFAKANADFDAGIDTFYTSWMMLKNASEADKAANSTYQNNKSLALSGARTLLGYTVQTDKVNAKNTDKVKELINEYVNVEPDKSKKAQAIAILATYYRSAGEFDLAIEEYRKALTISPNEPDALFGLGISLVSTGYNDDGSVKKPQVQEAANFLKRFVDSSPTNKKMVSDANETLELLKSSGITPKK